MQGGISSRRSINEIGTCSGQPWRESQGSCPGRRLLILGYYAICTQYVVLIRHCPVGDCAVYSRFLKLSANAHPAPTSTDPVEYHFLINSVPNSVINFFFSFVTLFLLFWFILYK